MSTTYSDLIYSSYPDSCDTYEYMQDISVDTYLLVKQYQSLVSQSKFDEANQLLVDNPNLNRSMFNAEKYNKLIDSVKAIERLYFSDIQMYIMELIQYKSSFLSTTKYSKYDIVSYTDSMIYMCISLNCPLGTLPTDTDYWIPLSIKGEQGESGIGLSFVGEWNETTIYSSDSAVTYNNCLYASISNNNEGHTPSKSSSYWSLIFDLSLANNYDNSVSNSSSTTTQGAIDELYSKVNINTTKLNTIEEGAQVNTVIGVKGNSESSYRTGNINITPANLGITVINNTADANKSVKYATSAGTASACTGNAATATSATSATNADKVDGFHANTTLTTSALKPIYAGTTDMTAGSTTLTKGHIYIVYE